MSVNVLNAGDVKEFLAGSDPKSRLVLRIENNPNLYEVKYMCEAAGLVICEIRAANYSRELWA